MCGQRRTREWTDRPGRASRNTLVRCGGRFAGVIVGARAQIAQIGTSPGHFVLDKWYLQMHANNPPFSPFLLRNGNVPLVVVYRHGPSRFCLCACLSLLDLRFHGEMMVAQERCQTAGAAFSSCLQAPVSSLRPPFKPLLLVPTS